MDPVLELKTFIFYTTLNLGGKKENIKKENVVSLFALVLWVFRIHATTWLSGQGILGACPSDGILKVGALDVGSKFFFVSQGEAGSLEFTLDHIALCWE